MVIPSVSIVPITSRSNNHSQTMANLDILNDNNPMLSSLIPKDSPPKQAPIYIAPHNSCQLPVSDNSGWLENSSK